MCGIAGYLQLASNATAADLAVIGRRMADTLAHRGPDDAGIWVDARAGIVLGHRRLSILDLTPAGHQPMVSSSERYVIAFNGEIYNWQKLKDMLEESRAVRSWRGHSDTEILLAAIEAWGFEAAIRRTVGMFAFAVWDRDEEMLCLGRDRLGEKPLYYGLSDRTFLFASELKALRAFPGFAGEIDRDALALFMRHSYLPAPHSIYRGIFKLPPGHLLMIPLRELRRRSLPRPTVYWSASDAVAAGALSPFAGSDSEATDELERILRQAVAGQIIADVPLGAFLSGGIDSSTIVALTQTQSARPVKTFTIGFTEADYDEARHARTVAQHLGTEHTELYVTPTETMEIIPRIPTVYDEPFADSSQVPTMLVAELARRHVTVSLSGDGGDELLGGYNRYIWVKNIWRSIGWAPASLRAALMFALLAAPPRAWNRIFKTLGLILPRRWRYAHPGDKLHKLAELLSENGPKQIYRALISIWKNPEDIVRSAHEPGSRLTESDGPLTPAELQNRMMYLDLITYLPDDILVKVDRAAMDASLETRTPFLDHRVVEFAWRLPLSMKIRNGEGKWLLRQVAYRYIPRQLLERPKSGFGLPIDGWLRGPLRDWVEGLLAEDRLRDEGFFEAAPIRQKWHEHLSGVRNWQHQLWSVLMFQAWWEAQRSTPQQLNRGARVRSV